MSVVEDSWLRPGRRVERSAKDEDPPAEVAAAVHEISPPPRHQQVVHLVGPRVVRVCADPLVDRPPLGGDVPVSAVAIGEDHLDELETGGVEAVQRPAERPELVGTALERHEGRRGRWLVPERLSDEQQPSRRRRAAGGSEANVEPRSRMDVDATG